MTTANAATTTTSPTTAPTTTTVASPPAGLGLRVPADLRAILLTIRIVESTDRYDLPPGASGASGAYQYIPTTWNNYLDYPHAYLAPPAVQDQRALTDVQAILAAWQGDVSMIPVIWYYPRAATSPELVDQVPNPRNNVLTVREYQRRWLDTLAYVSGNKLYRTLGMPPDIQVLTGAPPELADNRRQLSEIAAPVLGTALQLPPTACPDERCGTGTDAVVLGTALQPVLAATDGVVTSVDDDDPRSGGLHVTLTDAAGRTYHYRGFNDAAATADGELGEPGSAPGWMRLTPLARVGGTVRAGQVIGFMGLSPLDGTTEAVAHIRLTIRDADGVRLDTDRLVADARSRQECHVGLGPWTVQPSDGDDARSHADDDTDHIDADDDDDDIDRVVRTEDDGGTWTLERDGGVTALGTAALIAPPGGCEWEPEVAFGTDAAGSPAPPEWDDPIELPAAAWVRGVDAGGLAGLGRP